MNLRGKDQKYSPVFRSYVILPTDEDEAPVLFLPKEMQTEDVKKHLRSEVS